MYAVLVRVSLSLNISAAQSVALYQSRNCVENMLIEHQHASKIKPLRTSNLALTCNYQTKGSTPTPSVKRVLQYTHSLQVLCHMNIPI